MNQGESESTQELLDTNRNLSAAMDKIEMRCKIQEEKIEKLKKYKQMFKNCSCLQCVHCQRSISSSLFAQHLATCQVQPQEPQEQLAISSTSSRHNSQFAIDISQLQISINQTMVRETSDNKPYTEYMIKVSYEYFNIVQIQYLNKRWTVSRRYKNFCELHSSLLSQFPGIKLPESSQAIINTADIANIFNNKRPTVIEERRKALQQYIRDLAKIDLGCLREYYFIFIIVRNCKIYRNFLDLDQEEQRSISQLNSPQGYDPQQILHSSRDYCKDSLSMSKQWKQSTQLPSTQQLIGQSARSSISGKEQPKQKENRIDRKLLPQSPSSFLKQWNEKQKSLIFAESDLNVKIR